MRNLIVKYLGFNFLFVILSVVYPDYAFSQSRDDDAGKSSLIMFDQQTGRAGYSVNIEFKEAGLSGIIIFKRDKDVIRGSLVNEFGVKAFDMVYDCSRDRLRLYNVIKFLDRWYIRMTIASDLKPLFLRSAKLGKRRSVEINGNDILITNMKRGIKYRFSLIK